MRKIKEVLRLYHLDALSERQIARGANMRKTTVRNYLNRAERAGLTWDQAREMNEDELELALFPPEEPSDGPNHLPDWQAIHQEMKRKGVTRQLLWEEYLEKHPTGLRYSRFCELYSKYTRTIDVSMRQTHKAGEKLFVDYSGTKIPIIDARTGEERMAEVFVAVMGASNYTYAEATRTQRLPDWIGSHVRALTFFGGVPVYLVPDNLKSGVRKASYYDPELNPTYQRFAEHYGIAVLPARPVHPKDKSKAEAGVLLVLRWIIARLRHRTFFTLDELNEAIGELVIQLNTRPFKKMAGSRKTHFESIDAPMLRPLPSTRYEYDEWKKATVNIDYHISYEDHFYSVPYVLVRQEVTIRSTSMMIEIFHKGVRVASHHRSYRKYGHTTIADHMPDAHRQYAEWTPERLIEWGRAAGDHVAALFDSIMRARPHPEQGFRSCLGIMRLEKKVGKVRLDAACQRAQEIGANNYSSVRLILERGQEHVPLLSEHRQILIHHENVRGAVYYRSSAMEECHAASSDD